MDKMTEAQKAAYIEAHNVMQQQMLSMQQHKMKLENHYVPTLKVPHVPQPNLDQYNKPAHESTFTMVPDDGMGYDDGVRVLRSIGTWSENTMFYLHFACALTMTPIIWLNVYYCV